MVTDFYKACPRNYCKNPFLWYEFVLNNLETVKKSDQIFYVQFFSPSVKKLVN